MERVHIIGGGLAGSEAAWQLANAKVPVTIYEMRPNQRTDAHKTSGLAELVCSNSFRSDNAEQNAVGLLHEELRRCDSLIMSCADNNQVPAGSALAVDRGLFSDSVTERIASHPLIEIERKEITELPADDCKSVIIATGPLTSPRLSQSILRLTDEKALAFFDAIAPIIHFDSINLDIAWFQSRYDKIGPGGTIKDYINCPLEKQQYEEFVDSLLTGEQTVFKEWEKNTPYFDGCLPIEEMAKRGRETLRHGPMKPKGLTNAHAPDQKPHAVVQLRQDNALGTLYNMVGFQTKLKYGAQTEILRKIPGLENAQFARMGGLHRNTFLNSPKLLDESLRLRAVPRIRFAGQITGCEGYVESAGMGCIVGRFFAREHHNLPIKCPPSTTALGSLLKHITGGHIINEETEEDRSFQPMNINFGLFPPIEFNSKFTDGKKLKRVERNMAKRKAISERALSDLKNWLAEIEI